MALHLDDLLAIDRNRQSFARLREQTHGALGIVPFVGAGLSIPCGMPGWTAFLLNEAERTDATVAIRDHVDAARFEEAAQCLADALGPLAFHDALEHAFGAALLAGKEIRGPARLLPGITRGPVFTTNFDRVIEAVFERAGRAFEERVWGAKPDMLRRALHENRRYLVKLHGDVEERTERVLTLNDYKREYGARDVADVDLKRPLPRCLEQLFTTRTLLFLGASLGADRTVRLLRRVGERHGAPPPHYAIVERPRSDDATKERLRFFSNHCIRPIWFPAGEYGAVEILLSALLDPPGKLPGAPIIVGVMAAILASGAAIHAYANAHHAEPLGAATASTASVAEPASAASAGPSLTASPSVASSVPAVFVPARQPRGNVPGRGAVAVTSAAPTAAPQPSAPPAPPSTTSSAPHHQGQDLCASGYCP